MGIRQRHARVSRAERHLRRLEQQSAEKAIMALLDIANTPPDPGTFSDAWELASQSLDEHHPHGHAHQSRTGYGVVCFDALKTASCTRSRTIPRLTARSCTTPSWNSPGGNAFGMSAAVSGAPRSS